MSSNQKISIAWMAFIGLLAYANCAQALITCSASSTGFSNGYVPSNPTTSVASATFSVTCSRDNSGGPPSATVQYDMLADNGINASGTQNRAALAGSFLNYHLATDPACATQWKGTTTLPVPSESFGLAKNTVVTNSYTFYGCIPSGQLALPPEGTYTDTVTMTFSLAKATGPSAFIGGTIPVNIIAPASCNISTPPSNINFSYTAFSATPVLGNTTYGVTCTQTLAYSMSLDATVDVVAGLNYSLALNTSGSGGVNPLTSTGTGVEQSFFINGTMAAGQAATCATATCTGTQIRTLTISY
jgi:spore coat protein U-like protein